MSNVEVQTEHVIVSTSQTLYGTEVVPEGRFTFYDHAYRVWLLVRYPRKNYDQDISNLTRPAKLQATAEKLLQARDPFSQKGGRDSMATILAEYPVELQDYFESEYVAIPLAEMEI